MSNNNNGPQDGLTFTLGELFPGGGGLDVLHGNQLVLWRDDQQEIAATLPVNGRVYVVAPMDPSLIEAVHFPIGSEEFGTLEGLAEKLEEAISTLCPELEPDARLCLAAFILSSWVPECVPTAPLINIWGALGAETRIVDVLSYLCRRPLVLAEASVGELFGLPAGLCPTLILTQPSGRTIQNLLGAAASQQHNLLRGGELRRYRHAAVVCTRTPLSAPAYTVQVLPSANQHRLSAADASRLMHELVPRLVRYRLTRHQLVSASSFDCARFSPETRLIGRVFGSAFEGAEQLQVRLLDALRAADEQHKGERSQQTAALVLEALLVLCKEGKSFAFVEEITQLVNAILLGRHEERELSAKKVGMLLRSELGLRAERRSHGYQVTLDNATRQRLARLADAYGVLTLLSQQAASEVHDVHEVYAAEAGFSSNVHDVHDVHSESAAEGQS